MKYLSSIKANFSRESSNLICVVVCSNYVASEKENIELTVTITKEWVMYKEHINQPQNQPIKVEEHVRICSNDKNSGKFHSLLLSY